MGFHEFRYPWSKVSFLIKQLYSLAQTPEKAWCRFHTYSVKNSLATRSVLCPWLWYYPLAILNINQQVWSAITDLLSQNLSLKVGWTHGYYLCQNTALNSSRSRHCFNEPLPSRSQCWLFFSSLFISGQQEFFFDHQCWKSLNSTIKVFFTFSISFVWVEKTT